LRGVAGLLFDFQAIQVIRPFLHHFPALNQKFGTIVCPPEGTAYRVPELLFQQIFPDFWERVAGFIPALLV